MGDKSRGLYPKFCVLRNDGRDQPGEKHEGCEYFVLDLTHDPHATPALMAYAASCFEEHPLLAADLLQKCTSTARMSVIVQVAQEVARATVKFPTWPTDPLHALAVLGEEYGELTKAMLQLTYEPHKTSPAEVRMEAIQTAAMALRLVENLDRYEYLKCDQHAQLPMKADGRDIDIDDGA